jgi:hypothetical protein
MDFTRFGFCSPYFAAGSSGRRGVTRALAETELAEDQEVCEPRLANSQSDIAPTPAIAKPPRSIGRAASFSRGTPNSPEK